MAVAYSGWSLLIAFPIELAIERSSDAVNLLVDSGHLVGSKATGKMAGQGSAVGMATILHTVE